MPWSHKNPRIKLKIHNKQNRATTNNKEDQLTSAVYAETAVVEETVDEHYFGQFMASVYTRRLVFTKIPQPSAIYSNCNEPPNRLGQ